MLSFGVSFYTSGILVLGKLQNVLKNNKRDKKGTDESGKTYMKVK